MQLPTLGLTVLCVFCSLNKCLTNSVIIPEVVTKTDVLSNKTLKQAYLQTTTNDVSIQINNEVTQPVVANHDKKDETTMSVEFINSTQIPRVTKLDVKQNIDKKKFVKLNMKQRLIMNQILGVYALDDVKNALCRNHSLEFKDALRAFEPWAMKMFDSSSKFQPGVLIGNLMDFGSFKQCIHIYAPSPYGEIRGKQCSLKISPTMEVVRKILEFRNISRKRFDKVRSAIEGASLRWSVCVPDSCATADVQSHFKRNIGSIAEGLDLNITLTDMDCYSLKDDPTFTYTEYAIISSIIGLVTVTGICSIIDIRNQKKNEKNGVVTKIFSAYSNAKNIFTYKKNDETGLSCLHGIRFLSIFYVVSGHRFLLTLFFPAVNALELMEWFLKYTSTVVIGGTVSVDTFFMLSGILVAYHTMTHLSKYNGKINWLLFYLHRYVRITPPYAFVVLIYATLVQHLGSGPIWKQTVAAVQKPCQYFWWSAILHIQSYVNPKYLCILQTWYLSCDMVFYLMSPLLVYPIWRCPRFGWTSLCIVYISSVTVSFYLAWINQYEAAPLITNQIEQSKYFTEYYIVPHARAPTYILGIACGCILYYTKNLKIKMNPVTVTAGWMWSTVLLLTVILGNHPFQLEEHDYNLLEASCFLAFSRSAWTLGVIWMVWACRHGYGGPVNTFLSHPVFQVLAKISYSIFLWHMLLQYLSYGALKLPIYFSDFSSIYKACADILLTSGFSLLFTILVECPSVNLGRTFFRIISGHK